ncbi:hypothetical protein DIPPA_33327 [Diplonema papillatum]|nr:hypothetical protein DIPPA_33327 [Diplonema papillatum]
MKRGLLDVDGLHGGAEKKALKALVEDKKKTAEQAVREFCADLVGAVKRWDEQSERVLQLRSKCLEPSVPLDSTEAGSRNPCGLPEDAILREELARVDVEARTLSRVLGPVRLWFVLHRPSTYHMPEAFNGTVYVIQQLHQLTFKSELDTYLTEKSNVEMACMQTKFATNEAGRDAMCATMKHAWTVLSARYRTLSSFCTRLYVLLITNENELKRSFCSM